MEGKKFDLPDSKSGCGESRTERCVQQRFRHHQILFKNIALLGKTDGSVCIEHITVALPPNLYFPKVENGANIQQMNATGCRFRSNDLPDWWDHEDLENSLPDLMFYHFLSLQLGDCISMSDEIGMFACIGISSAIHRSNINSKTQSSSVPYHSFIHHQV